MSNFSIIIPLYNKAATIVDTINSVQNQSHKDFEIVVINDGSTDGSEEKVSNISDNRIRLFSIPNGGASAARNLGAAKATGDWLIFLDADDLMMEGALEKFQSLISEHPDINVFAGNFILRNKGNDRIYSNKYRDCLISNNYKEWFMGRLMPCAGTCVFKKNIIEKYPFDSSLKRYEDASAYLDLMCSQRIFRFSRPVMVYNRDDSAASRPRTDISEDFLGHLDFEGKGFWESLVLYDFYIEAKNLYPSDISRLYPNIERKKLWLKLAYAAASRYRYAINKLSR